MKRPIQLALVFLAAMVVVLPVAAKKSSVLVRNLSEWTIVEFYMSPSDDDDWGRDLLGRDVLDPGDTLTLTNISCDDWDLMFIDEDDDECVLEEVDLCNDDAHWDITSRELIACVNDSR